MRFNEICNARYQGIFIAWNHQLNIILFTKRIHRFQIGWIQRYIGTKL